MLCAGEDVKMRCTVCGGDGCQKAYDLYDDRFGYKGVFKLGKCNSCGHKFLEGEFKPEMLVALYSNYDRRSEFDIENYQPYKEIGRFKAWLDGEYSFAFRWVPKNVRVLDIGCGFGETLGYHKARGCDVYGVEVDANIHRVAERFGYKVHVGLFDSGLYEENFFDYVTMDQVVEHTTDPIEVLKGLAKILKPGGHAVISLPNSNGWGVRVFGLAEQRLHGVVAAHVNRGWVCRGGGLVITISLPRAGACAAHLAESGDHRAGWRVCAAAE